MTFETGIEVVNNTVQNNPEFLSGDALLQFSNLAKFLEEISITLSEAPYSAYYSQEQLLEYIKKGQSVMAVCGDNWLSHAKLELYPADFGHPEVVELGSLLVNNEFRSKGIGLQTVLQALMLAEQTFPGVQKIAIVSKVNEAPNLLFGKLSQTLIPQPPNVPIKIPGEKNIYDLTQAAIDIYSL